jgi:beta-phosphoglucomutase
MMPVRAFIFDVDGVLTDTVELHYRSWVRLADEEGIAFDRRVNEQMRGLTRPASLEVFLAGRPVSAEQAQDYLERKNRYFLELLAELSERDLLPGVLPLLDELKAAGIRIGIGSASRNAREVVRRLGIASFIDAYADGQAVERSKPAPDVFLAAAELLDVTPAECVVVEDAEAGIEAAHAAGMQVVGVGPSARVGAADLSVTSLAGLTFDGILALLDKAGAAPGT